MGPLSLVVSLHLPHNSQGLGQVLHTAMQNVVTNHQDGNALQENAGYVTKIIALTT